MALRIAFDIDGVLADMDAALVHQARALFGEPAMRRLLAGPVEGAAPNQIAADPDMESGSGSGASVDTAGDSSAETTPTRLRRLSTRERRRLWRHVGAIENFWETLDETEPGGVRRLASLAADLRWQTIFLTKRPETAGTTAQRQTQRWLESKGFPLPSVFVVPGSRGRLAEALGLDVVVDDRWENCLDVMTDSTARAILVWRDRSEPQFPDAARRASVGVVDSVARCLDLLEQLDREGRDRPGLMQKLASLLGLRAPSTR